MDATGRNWQEGDMVPFIELFPEIGQAETRCAMKFRDDGGLPAGKYCFVESYCGAADCDCRRVFLNVESDGKWLATIGFGWEGKDYYRKWFGGKDADGIAAQMAGAALELSGHHSQYDRALLALFKDSLMNDRVYVERLKRHYAMFKAALKAGRGHGVKVLSEDELEEMLADSEGAAETKAKNSSGPGQKVGRNEPCPCGSGKKYKKCCMGKDSTSA